MIPTSIYIDADDTLLGWSEEMMFRLAGHRNITGLKNHFDYSQFGGATMRDVGAIMESADFWHSLQVTQHGREILRVVRALDMRATIVTLTPPPFMSIKSRRVAASAKLALADRFKMPIAVMSAEDDQQWREAKAAFAWPGSILVDDSTSGVRAFTGAGGQAITVPRPWNAATGNPAELLRFMCTPMAIDSPADVERFEAATRGAL